MKEISGVLQVTVPQPAKIRIVLLNPAGEVLETVYKSEDYVQGKGKFPYKYQALGLPTGEYILRVLGDEKVLKEEVYKLE